jgi:hypothetical protein
MKRSLVVGLCLLLLGIMGVNAQTPSWQWGSNNQCYGDDEANAVTTDKYGNVYVAGVFTDQISIDTIVLYSNGGHDVFLIKYSPTGQVIWAKSGGSSAEEEVNSITTDTSGNVIVTGSFGGHTIYPITYNDTAYFSNSTIVSNGNMDIFLIDYLPNGNINWIRNYGSIYNDMGNSLKCNKKNQIVFGGIFSDYGGSPPVHGTIQFDNMFYLTSAGNSDLFLCTLNENGTVLWAKKYGNKERELFTKLSLDINDNICVLGIFYYSINFNGIIVSSLSSVSVDGDCFIAKFDSLGNIIWAKAIGGANIMSSSGGSVTNRSMMVGEQGNVYILGDYGNCTLIFQGSSITLPNEYAAQIFLAKYDSNGNLMWAREMGGSSDDVGLDLFVGQNENCYATGLIRYYGIFGSDSVHCYGFNDAFIAKYDSLGNEHWAIHLGGNSNDYGSSITGTSDGSLCLAGAYSSTYFMYKSEFMINDGGYDMFLVKLSPTTGINDVVSSASVAVYPNPATDILTIEAKQKGRFEMVDLMGRTLLQSQIITSATLSDQSLSIDMKPFAPGIYFIKYQNEKETETIKVIKQ